MVTYDRHLDLGDIALFKCYKFLYGGAEKCGNIANGDGPPNLKEYEGMWALYKPWLGEGMHHVPFIHAFGNHDGEVSRRASAASSGTPGCWGTILEITKVTARLPRAT